MPPGGGGMGTKDPVQCNSNGEKYSYSGDESVGGTPIAGVDSKTFGSDKDGTVGDACGQCAMIRGTKFIVVDRIWQNGGAGSDEYTGSSSNKQSTGKTGHNQIDVAGSVANKWYQEDKAKNDVDHTTTYGDQDMHVEVVGC